MRSLRWIEGIGTGRVRLAGSLAAGWAMLVLVLVTGRPVRRARGQGRERDLSKTGEAKGKCEDWEGTANERRWTRMDTSTGPAGRDGSVVVPPASCRMLQNPDVVSLTRLGALPNLDCMTTGIVILILLLVVALGIRHLQRTFFYPRPGRMPDVVDQEIDAVLVSFETTLKTHAPDVLSALNPGLSDEDIREIESKYRLRLTDDLRALYRWRNGSSGEDFVELIPGHRFLPLEETAQQRAGDREQLLAEPLVQRVAFWVFAGHRKNWFTILDDRAGAGYFYDPGRRWKGHYFFYHFDENSQYWFFPSLANFIAGAIECYETKIYRSGRRGSAGEDFERSAELWAKYAAAPRVF